MPLSLAFQLQGSFRVLARQLGPLYPSLVLAQNDELLFREPATLHRPSDRR
jgi:hypothetical protein